MCKIHEPFSIKVVKKSFLNYTTCGVLTHVGKISEKIDYFEITRDFDDNKAQES